MSIKFGWDPRNAAVNVTKHGVTFEEAQLVFADERAKLIDDPDHADDEDRFALPGLTSSVVDWALKQHDVAPEGLGPTSTVRPEPVEGCFQVAESRGPLPIMVRQAHHERKWVKHPAGFSRPR